MQSRNPPLEFLLHAAKQSANPGDARLNEILQRSLRDVASSHPEWQDTSCLFQDVGDFLIRTTDLLSRLAERVVLGAELHDYATIKIEEMDREHDFSELGGLDDLEGNHRSLKSITEKLVTTSKSLSSQWRTCKKQYAHRRRDCWPSESEASHKSESPSTPSREPSPGRETRAMSFQQSPVLPNPQFHSSLSPATLSPGIPTPVIPSPLSPCSTIVGQPAHHRLIQTPQPHLRLSEDDLSPDSQVHELLETLTQRGTGQHCCPHGLSCTKGGVADGVQITFERNSAFRAHLQKHEKQFRCELPGCTARGGFARIDQLRRHQSTVSHRG